MSNTIRGGRAIDLNVQAGESLKVSTISGTYTATVLAGAGKGTNLATDSSGGGTYGPYASAVTIRIKTSADGLADFDVAVTPVLNYYPNAFLGSDSDGNISSLVDGAGNAVSLGGSAARGGLVAAMGDSITEGQAWFDLACALSGGRMRRVVNTSVGGETSTQQLARITTVTGATPKPDYCFVLIGANDITSGAPGVATLRTNLSATYAALIAANIEPICCTLLPRSGVSAAFIGEANAFIKGVAHANGWHVIDFYKLMVDSAATTWKAGGYTSDQVHPTALGNETMAAAVISSGLLDRLSLDLPRIAYNNGDTTNKIANGLFVIDSNADGTPDSWTFFGGGTGVVQTLPDDASGFGKIWTWTLTNPASTTYASTVTASAGDLMEILFRVQQPTARTDGLQFRVVIDPNGAGATETLWSSLTTTQRYNLADGVVAAYYTMPSDATSFTIQLLVNGGAYSSVVGFGQVTVRNLTALGITPAVLAA